MKRKKEWKKRGLHTRDGSLSFNVNHMNDNNKKNEKYIMHYTTPHYHLVRKALEMRSEMKNEIKAHYNLDY